MTFESIIQELLPFILSAVVGMQLWFLRQIMAIKETLTRLETSQDDNSDLKRDVNRQEDTTSLHATKIQGMEVKLDLILKKVESLEQNCLLHRLLQRADPEQLLRILQAAKLNHE